MQRAIQGLLGLQRTAINTAIQAQCGVYRVINWNKIHDLEHDNLIYLNDIADTMENYQAVLEYHQYLYNRGKMPQENDYTVYMVGTTYATIKAQHEESIKLNFSVDFVSELMTLVDKDIEARRTRKESSSKEEEPEINDALIREREKKTVYYRNLIQKFVDREDYKNGLVLLREMVIEKIPTDLKIVSQGLQLVKMMVKDRKRLPTRLS